MWVKKTEKDLIEETKEAEKKRNEPKYWRGIKLTPINSAILAFLGFFAFVFIFIMSFELIFGEARGHRWLPTPRNNVSLSDIPQELPFYFFMATTLGIIFAILIFFFEKAEISDKYKGWIHNNVTTQLCQKCHKVKADNGIYTCDCGGEYILITKMKWVEPEKDDVEKG